MTQRSLLLTHFNYNFVVMSTLRSLSDFIVLDGKPVRESPSDEQGVLSAGFTQEALRADEEQLVASTATCENNDRCSGAIRFPEFRDEMGRDYRLSENAIELGACAVWFTLSFLVPSLFFGANQRPIPYQYLETSGDYARNLVNNEVTSGSTVSVLFLVLLGMILPLALELLASRRWGKPGDPQSVLCVNLVAQGTTQWATESIKLYVGYLRPIFYSACDPSNDYQTCSGSTQDVRKSFPSGHSSTAFCGLTLLALYFHHRLGVGSIRTMRAARIDPSMTDALTLAASDAVRWVPVYDPTFHHDSRLHRRMRSVFYFRFVSLASFVLSMGLAAFIAASRVADNKHFPADVVGGAALGLGIAVCVNSLWYAEM
jgi:membrane-associated phospholipid phosphatase